MGGSFHAKFPSGSSGAAANKHSALCRETHAPQWSGVSGKTKNSLDTRLGTPGIDISFAAVEIFFKTTKAIRGANQL